MTAVTGDRPVAAGNGSWARLARSEALRGFALVSPTFLYALLLLLAPILVIVAFSFWTQDYLTIDRTFPLANYREAWTEPPYRVLMLLTLAAGSAARRAGKEGGG